MFALDVRHPPSRQWLEGGAKASARFGGVLGDAALLAAVVGQEHHDAVGLAVAIGPQYQAVGGIDPHRLWGQQSNIHRWRTTCQVYPRNEVGLLPRPARAVEFPS